MNRQERRRPDRQYGRRRIEQMKRELTEQITAGVSQAVTDGRVEALMACFCLALNDEFGFGRERCLRVLNRLDELMGPWVTEAKDSTALMQEVENRVGIRLTTRE